MCIVIPLARSLSFVLYSNNYSINTSNLKSAPSELRPPIESNRTGAEPRASSDRTIGVSDLRKAVSYCTLEYIALKDVLLDRTVHLMIRL